MTKEEMKTLIAEKISGQGNQVDAGGALPTVLGEIIDAIPTEFGLQFGGVLSDGDTVPETPNMFYVAGAGDYSVTEEEAVPVEEGNIAFFIVDAQGEASVQTIAVATGGGSTITIPEYEYSGEEIVDSDTLASAYFEDSSHEGEPFAVAFNRDEDIQILAVRANGTWANNYYVVLQAALTE